MVGERHEDSSTLRGSIDKLKLVCKLQKREERMPKTIEVLTSVLKPGKGSIHHPSSIDARHL